MNMRIFMRLCCYWFYFNRKPKVTQSPYTVFTHPHISLSDKNSNGPCCISWQCSHQLSEARIFWQLQKQHPHWEPEAKVMEGRGRQNLSSPALFFASSLETNTEVTKKAISSILKYFASLGKKIFRTFAWSKALNKTQCFMRLDLMVTAVQNVS